MAHLIHQAELRSSTMEYGEQSVMTSGILMLHMLPVKCLALLKPSTLGMNLILEEGVDQYGWMMFSVLAVKVPCMNVPIATGVYIIVDILKM